MADYVDVLKTHFSKHLREVEKVLPHTLATLCEAKSTAIDGLEAAMAKGEVGGSHIAAILEHAGSAVAHQTGVTAAVNYRLLQHSGQYLGRELAEWGGHIVDAYRTVRK